MNRAAALLLIAACACQPRESRRSADSYEDDELEAEVLEELEPPDPADAPPAVGTTGALQERPPQPDDPPPIVPAADADDEFDRQDPVIARRYVYRVDMTVPAGLGEAQDPIARPAAELFVDVGHERLRARFAGVGWPIAAGSEVRLRRDRPGVYVFDAQGGRPLPPGEMAAWFEGGRITRRGPPLRVYPHFGMPRHQSTGDGAPIPGELVCALLAEWAGEPRENVMRRCERGAPHLWRLGFWRAEQTADVPVELPRSALRADEHGPPTPIASADSRAFLEPAALGRISARPVRSSDPASSGGRGLDLENLSSTRAIVTLRGVPIGWIDRGGRGLFVGLAPGVYELGAIRPLGAVVQRDREVRVPSAHRICDGRCPRPGAPVPDAADSLAP